MAELARVERAASDVRASRTKYREALLAAWEYGYSYAEIARAAGVSRQAVRQALMIPGHGLNPGK